VYNPCPSQFPICNPLGGSVLCSEPGIHVAAWLLNPQPGETVFDLFAGVGGKTTQMAELMNNQGKIIAFDIYPQKLDLLAKNASVWEYP